ncbi:DNA-directed RNA polymerase sigma-70 factor [Prolixibacter sp. NT017]|nr:DNA-directed RNA polymerase sigma-70 factor [Prolixibacter sp. NT017]
MQKSQMIQDEDNRRLLAIREGDKQAFEALFHECYRPMVAYAFRFLGEMEPSESVVQDVFLKFWQKRKELMITSSLRSYLFRAVRNLSLNYLEHRKIMSGYASMVIERESDRHDYSDFYVEVGLREKIDAAVSALPEKRQEIFRLAREEGLKYREIAEQLNISVKTVETQMTLALKQLRTLLKDYRHLVLFFLGTGINKTKEKLPYRSISVKGKKLINCLPYRL